MRNYILVISTFILISSCSKYEKRGKSRKFKINQKNQNKVKGREETTKWREGVLLNKTASSNNELDQFSALLPKPKYFHKKINVKQIVKGSNGLKFENELKAYEGQTYLYLYKNDQLMRMSDNYDLNTLFLLTPKDEMKSIAFQNHTRLKPNETLTYELNFSLQKNWERKSDDVLFNDVSFNLHDLDLEKQDFKPGITDSDIAKTYQPEITYRPDSNRSDILMLDHLFISIDDGSLIKNEEEFGYRDVFNSVKKNTFTFIYSSPSAEFVQYLNESVDFKKYLETFFKGVRISHCNEVVKVGPFSSNAGVWHTNLDQFMDCKTRKINIKNGSTVYFIYERSNYKVPAFKKNFSNTISLSRSLQNPKSSVSINNSEMEKNYMILDFSSHFYEFSFFAHFYSPQAGCHIFSEKKRKVVNEKTNLYNFDDILKEIKINHRQKNLSLIKIVKAKKAISIGKHKYYLVELPYMENFSISLPEKPSYLSTVENICPQNTAKKYIKSANQIFLSNIDAKAERNNKIFRKMETSTQINIILANEEKN